MDGQSRGGCNGSGHSDKEVTPWMKDGGGGSIVNISSLAGLVDYSSPVYGEAKAAVISLSKWYVTCPHSLVHFLS